MADPTMMAVAAATVAAAAANQKPTGVRITLGGFLFALMAYFSAALCVVFVVGCLVRLLG